MSLNAAVNRSKMWWRSDCSNSGKAQLNGNKHNYTVKYEWAQNDREQSPSGTYQANRDWTQVHVVTDATFTGQFVVIYLARHMWTSHSAITIHITIICVCLTRLSPVWHQILSATSRQPILCCILFKPTIQFISHQFNTQLCIY